MSRYDGLIIPRSYSEYLNKTDSATLSQMLQHLTGLWSHAVSSGDNKPVISDAVYEALTNYINKTDAATLQQALQLPGVLSGAVAAGDNKAVKSSAVATALANQTSCIESVRLDFTNNRSSEKIIRLGVMETATYGRAGLNLDITYRRVDTVGRIFATLVADEMASKYLCITPAYKPIVIKKTRITDGKKYNVYLKISNYTPIIRVIINAPLGFSVQNEEVTELEGTEVSCTAVAINDL